MNDEVKKLYSALLSKGYSTADLGDEETFRSKMSDKNSRKELYDWVSSKGNFRLGDYESYENRLTSSIKQPEQTAAPVSTTAEAPEVEAAAQPALTEQDKIRFSAGIEQMKRRTQKSMDEFNDRMATMREYHDNAPLGGGQTAEGRMMFNPQSGKFEKTYITPLGNRYTSKGLADMESFRYRQAADMSVSGQLRRARLKLAELQAQRNERANEVHDEATEFNNTKLTPLGRLLVGGDIYVAQQQSDPEKNALNVAIRQTEELIKDLEEQQDREQGKDVGFWRGFGRIAGDFRTWDFGMSDLSDAMTMMHADQLTDENATEGERAAYNEMMGAIYNKEQAEQAYGGNASFWNRAGVMTGYMPSFMLDFVITGGGFEGISLLSKGGTRAATKVIGSEVVEEMAEQGFKTYVRNNGIKGFGQYAGNWTIKALGTMGDDLLIRAPLMTNTVQFGKTTSDIIDRKLGDVVVNEDGTYDFSNDKTWGSAIWQGEANAIIENYSEMFGAHLDPVVTLGNMSKLANVVGAKRLGAVLSKADAGALSGIMGQTHQLFNKMGVSDYFGEVTEEYYGQMWRTMLNLDDAYQQNPDGTRTNLLATGKFHGDIWGGMALSMGLMGAGKHTISATQYTSMKHSVNKADAHATELLGKEVWEPLRTTLDLTTNDDMGAMAEAIVNDQNFTDEERAAVLTYMERSMMMRGYNLGTLAQRRGAAQDEDIQALDESYMDGYGIETSQEMNDAKNMLDYQRQRVSAIVDEDLLAFMDSNPMNALEEVRSNGVWNDEARATILDYLNAKQVYDGMIQRVRDDIDGRIDQSNAMVNARTNRTTGMIQGATMKVDDRRVYVINGNLVQYADGSGIDIEASDNSIIVRDAETGALEQVSPDAILNIDEALDPITEMQTAADAIRQQYAQEAANRIDGVVTFNPGDTYTITGDDAQIQVQIVANDEGIVDNGDGTVNVSDGTNVFPLAKETIQQQAEAAQLARVAQFEQQRAAENAAYQQAVEEESRPQYALNDLVSLRDENGNAVRGNITTDADADGRYEVYTEAPINGKRVNLFTRDELDSMLMEHNGVVFEQPADNEGNNGGENIPENGNNAPQNIPAMQRIPKDMQGNPLYEQTDSDTAWDAIVEQTEGDEAMAQTVADGMVADKEAALKKLEKAKSKGGATIADKIAAEKERKAAIDAAQQEVNIWKKIAGTANRRRMDAEAERRRIADEAAALRKAEEEKLRAEREEAERIEREALNGVPDMVDDTPQDARARGYRRVSGHKIDRQEPVQGLQGKEVAVRFSDDAIANGRVAVIDATQLQPSHIQGVRNPLHFIDEAQPKERNDEASVMSARKIAGNIRPEEITSSVTAYTGAPTVNARGEAIQGNNRSDALRLMWESHEDQAAQYKQYLIDHADEFGLNADDVAAMERPVLVNMLDVDDAEAITLGQFVAQDTESGGTERIKPKNALQKMGNDMRSFANLLLKSNDEDTSFAGLVDNNGVEVLKWMSQRGYITPTQYKSAFDSKGNLTAEAKNDLRGIMYQSIFKGGSTRLEEMFNAMPAKAQKAILATAFRDYDSPNADRMIEEIQNSIRAFYALSQSEDFVNAKTFKDARLAVEGWKIQYQIDDVTGESYLPAENFSNFALLLATMYKGENQSVIQGTFNKLYDLIQGTQEPNLFEQPDNTPRSLAQAIYETLNITYDGQQRSNVLVGDSSASQRGQQGSTGDAATGERVENGERTADSAGSIEAESTTGGETVHQPQPERKGLEQTSDVGRKGDSTGVADDATQEVLGASNRGDIRVLEEGLDTSYSAYSDDSERTRRTAESERLVSLAKQHGLFIPAEVIKTLTGKVAKRTGESVVYIDTAAGKVTKVKDPYAKAAMKSGVQPEDAAFEHRVHNLLFPETAYTLEGISEEMGDVRIVLSQDFIQNYDQPTKEQIAEALAARGLFPEDNYSFGNELVSVTDVEGDNVLLGEDGTVYFIDPIIRFKKPLREILAALGGAEQNAPTIGEQIQAAEAEVNTNPTEAQKEAGNYKKGHVQIGTFNVTIEQPKGSVRSGVDKGGKKWEIEMQNTYGYIRGTEGVDGDHIDVFLSDDIDGWDGHKVFVVDQRNADGSFDEHKVMLGFNDINDAEAAYMSNYEEGWQGLGAITGVSIEEFEKWIASSHRKTKAFAEYKSVKTTEGQSASAERRNLADFKEGDVVRDYYDKKLYRIKKHSKNGVSTIAMLDEEGNEVGTTQMNAHNNSRYSLAEAPVKAETPTISQDSEQVSDQDNAPYTIAPAQYTTKKGKVLDMHLVKFAGTLTKEQQRAAKELAKADKGWYDREQGGFMMRSEESAKQLADTILNNDDAVSDAQPVSMTDIQALNNGDVLFTEPQQPKEQPKDEEYHPIWQYSIHIDADGYTTISRDDVSSGYPIGDARFRYSTDSPEEMLDILRNPLNGMQEALEAVGVTLENKIKTRELDRKIKEEREQKRAELRTNGVNGYKIGDKVIYTPASGTRKAINATIHDFEEFGENKPVLDVGLAPVMYEVVEWSDIAKVESSKTALLDDEGAADDKTLALSAIGKTFTRMGETESGKPYEETLTFTGHKGGYITAEMNTVGYGGSVKMNVAEAAEALRNGRWQEKIATESKNEGQFGLVSDERMTELKERLRKKLGGQMNIGIDPEILAIGLEIAVGHLDRGVKTFTDFAKVMISDLGDVIRPYLKAFYNGARELPEVIENGLASDMTSYDEVQSFDVANFDKQGIDAFATAETVTREAQVAQEVEVAQERIKKTRSAKKETKKKSVTSQEQTGGLFDDLFAETNKADAVLHRQFAMTVKADMLAALDNGTKPYRSILDLRKRASELGMEVDSDGRTDILLQELVEDGLVRAAREVIGRKGRNSRASYDLICKLYEMQPTIAARSSNRIKMQQYSTPLPMAWIANHFAMANKAGGKVLEPTAGNGMLVFTVPVEQVHANELDETRLDNLREQGFAEVTQQDATEPFEGGMQYDVVIANPPFGKREAVEYDGKMIPGLDPQITLNALASMKDDGRAAIIIGGNMEYASNGAIKSMKPFFTYLYDHYNVKGVIDMSGGLYAKQGTTFPTRMILIDGRRSDEERAQTAVYPPVESKAIRKAETFNDLYEIINEVLNSNEKTNGTEILRSRQGQLASVNSETSRNTDGAGHRGQHRKNDDVGSRGNRTAENDTDRSEQVLPREHRTNNADGETRAETPRDNAGGSRSVSDTDIQRVGTERVSASGVGLTQTPTEHKKRTLTDEKSAYRPHNSAFSLNSVAPAAMVEAMDKVLTQIEAQHGSIDEFIRTELGYDTVAEAHQALAAEQMDSVAMAIYQMKQGQALIIGDQTGVGKGRQMAALIRWAVKRGEKPVFITQKADLFSDIYRDLVDVGSGDLVPFIFNSDGAMVDSKGNTVHKPLSSAEMAKVFASGVLPDKYDFAVLTYSQVNTGDAVSQQEMDEAAKKNGARTKKSKNVKNGKATPKATFLRAIAEDNYLFLDESHTAAGSSNTGAYLQSILRGAKAATFASATFAKRPDTMPLYAIRTAMSQAKVEPDKMISIIEKGGVTLQEIMSRELTNAGQMVRRERDMSDVVTDWKTITDPETVRRARENYDRTIAAFNAIIKFQEDYVKPMIEALDMELAVMAESAGVKRGTDKMGVENVPFASKTYNYTKQLMLALKVDAIADEVEAEINAGRHPVIALESTMESSIKDYAPGEIIDEPTFSASLLKGLDTVMQYTVKDEDGNERHERYSPKALGPAGEKAYYDLQDFIRESTSDIFISPLDAIIERLNEKGYKVGELTGRNTYVERNADGRVVVKRRTDKDKKRMQREFNSGALDVLILNKSASTGISLHASEKFSDQRQRSMIIAQPLSDINDYMQMIGRIDRTGQVHRGYYINLGLPVPAENRFLMMLSTKLKSLNANTTTSQDSESNDVEAPDLLNKYGSQVVVEYLRDNVEIYERMGTPLKKGGLGGGRVQASELDDYKPQEDDARKITGYVALLTTKEQEEFYDDVVRRYNELIKYLNDTGSNDLKITVMPLRATTIEKRISSEGIDPNGNNPFARNSYVEKVEMDVLRKPMKADEIRKVIEQINRGLEPNAYLERVIDTVRKEDDARIAAEEERYEKSKAKAVEDIAKQTEKINGQKKRSDEEKRVAIENFIAETNEKVEAKHKDNIARLNYSSDQMMHRLRMFEVGKSYLVPDNLEAQIFDFATPAIFCGYKTKDSKITASTTLAVFATLDGRRRIEIKLSQIEALRSIDKMTNDNWDAARATTLDNWDSQIPSETRKNGYIMTGNILQAIADTQDQYGGYPGQLISYTDMDGNVHDGILMPDKWNATMLKTSGAPLSSRLQQIKEYQPVKSHDGKVEIMGSSWAKTFYLTVPKTKKDGAIYYENKTLLRAAGGNFYPYRGQLRADIPEEHITEVVKELTKLGVKVKEEHHSDDALNREGDGAYTDDEVSFENDPISKVLGKPRFTRKQRREFAERERQRMVARVENLAKKLNLDNVEIVTDASTLEGKKQRAKGFYTKSTGKITIVIPNHSSTFDVEQTLLHEAVAHYGLRQLFGEHFDTFLDNVFNNADEAIRQRIVALAAKNGWDFHKATEEYLAMLAENTEFENTNASWWRQIKDFFLNMLHKIGFEDFRGVTLTDNELRYILWRSYENLAEPGKYRSILGEAADVAKQYELGVGNYAVTNPNTPHAAESDDELYRDGTTLREEYDRKVRVPNKSGSVKWNENLPYRMKESYQDSMAALKTLQDLISEETGNQIQSHENAYMAENRMSSENKAQAEIYERDFYNPLRKAVQALIKAGSSYEDLKSYIIAKHGLERNEYMRTQAEQNGEDADRDFAGLTALTGMDDVADAEAEAQRMVDDYEQANDTADLWEKINAATKETLRKSYDSGLMDKATYDKVRDMYEYYVPLRGWDCEVASSEYEYLTSNKLMLSPALKVAKGRTSLADDPLATIGFMAESSIVQGNRNRMKQKFLNFILNNPTDLVSVSEQWYVLDNATGEWEARNPIIPDNATGDEVAAIVEQFEQEMEALGDKATKKRDGLKLSMNITKREGQEHVVRVKRNGKEYCLYINGSPRAAQAINGLTNPDVNDGSLYKAAKTVKNWMASMFTSKNPAFIATNLSRDVIWAGTAVAIKEDAAYTARYTKNISECLLKAQLPRLLVKFKNGTLDMNNELERYFDEFIRNGGETGFTQLNTVEDYKRNIERFVKEAQGKGSITKKAWNGLWDSVEFLNRSAEDTTRFMVYMTSRQMGRDMARSIYDAKEITVNFNKKGSGGLGASVMNFSYIFFNATIQSLANFGKLMAKHPAKTTIALTLFSSAGFLVPMLNLAIQAMLGSDDDDENGYWDLPEWVRRNNIVLYVPWSDNGYITIPLPHEMRPFYGMGEIAYSCLMDKENVEDGLQKSLAGFSALLPIDLTGNGGNIAVNMTPTIGQPFAQIIANTDYFGKPIYKRHEWNERDPEWTKVYKGTTPWLVDGTRLLNEATGGDNVKSGAIDLNPALIEHLFESYLGGVGKTINKSQKTLEMLWNEDLREWRNVPVVSSFYQTAEERTAGSQINREYYNAVDEMEDTQHLFSGYKREVKMGNIEYAEKVNELINSEVFKRYGLVKGYSNAINKATNALKLIEDPTKREDVETTIMNLKVEMLEKLGDLEERK